MARGVATVDIRNVRDLDYETAIGLMDTWWGGRHMADMLPRLFFQHFQDTSFVAVEREGDKRIVGFLVGFVSQTHPSEAYVHFVGVHPEYRKRGLGRTLYDRFFEVARGRGCGVVRCVTSPVNKDSIAFHLRLGFRIEPGDATTEDGTPVCSDYDGRGQSRVRFAKVLHETSATT